MLAALVKNGPKSDRCWRHRSDSGRFLAHYGMLQCSLLSPWKSIAVDHCSEAIKEAAPSLGAHLWFYELKIITPLWLLLGLVRNKNTWKQQEKVSVLKKKQIVLNMCQKIVHFILVLWIIYIYIYKGYLMHYFSWYTDAKEIYNCKNDKQNSELKLLLRKGCFLIWPLIFEQLCVQSLTYGRNCYFGTLIFWYWNCIIPGKLNTWKLMPWFVALRDHQQFYWLYDIGWSLSSTGKDLIYLVHMLNNGRKCKYIYMLPQITSLQ